MRITLQALLTMLCWKHAVSVSRSNDLRDIDRKVLRIATGGIDFLYYDLDKGEIYFDDEQADYLISDNWKELLIEALKQNVLPLKRIG